MRKKDTETMKNFQKKFGVKRWRKKIKIRRNYPFGKNSKADLTFIVKDKSSPLTSPSSTGGVFPFNNNKKEDLFDNEKQKRKHNAKSPYIYHGSRRVDSFHRSNKFVSRHSPAVR